MFYVRIFCMFQLFSELLLCDNNMMRRVDKSL